MGDSSDTLEQETKFIPVLPSKEKEVTVGIVTP